MTLDEIRNSTKEVLTPAEVAEVLGCDPQDIRVAAKHRPDMLGFHVCVLGSRVKIPRRAFLNWLEGGYESGNAG
jgi:hypothetical protein